MPVRRSREEQHVVPVREETATVRKQKVARGGVRLDKRVRTREAQVSETLRHDEAVVERIPVNRIVTEAPAVREEGDTLVIPLLEEVVVVTRQLVLREEVRVRKRVLSAPFVQNVTLRSEEVEVQELPSRHGNDADASGAGPSSHIEEEQD